MWYLWISKDIVVYSRLGYSSNKANFEAGYFVKRFNRAFDWNDLNYTHCYWMLDEYWQEVTGTGTHRRLQPSQFVDEELLQRLLLFQADELESDFLEWVLSQRVRLRTLLISIRTDSSSRHSELLLLNYITVITYLCNNKHIFFLCMASFTYFHISNQNCLPEHQHL